MAPPPRWLATLSAARGEAALSVRLYNDASENRAFEGFVVHMHLAWLYLLHALFTRDSVEFRYRDKSNPRRFERIDGEHKRWELARCVRERWPDDHDPVRKNLEFFIGLRNRVEHRHEKFDRNLALTVSGHCHALLLNFEEELTAQFGMRHSLAEILRFPVFIGTFTPEGERALQTLRDKLPARLKKYIADYHSGLSDDVSGDGKFELRLRVVLERATSDPNALAMQFTRWDDMTDKEKEAVLQMGKRGQTVVREQKRSIVGHGLLKPREAERQVAAAVPFVFNQHHFLLSWSRKNIRPPTDTSHPERTDERYCMYDALSRSYGYTPAWVRWLVQKCATATGFEEATGRPAVPKETAETPQET